MTDLEQELNTFCEAEWHWLDQVDEGLVCCHTFATLATIYSMKPFKDLDFHDQNIILYGLLFHDIAKRGPPEIETKDPLHPFTSAAKALKIFSRLGWIQHAENVEEISEYISNAFFFHEWANFMDNQKLPMIYKQLLYATGLISDMNSSYQNYYQLTNDLPREKLFVFEILAIILFHQSVDLDPKYPNFTPLTEEEMNSYLSPRLLNLLTILHIGDNGSYNLPLKRAKWDFDKRILLTQSRMTRKMKRVLSSL
jgi:hypothetical protein